MAQGDDDARGRGTGDERDRAGTLRCQGHQHDPAVSRLLEPLEVVPARVAHRVEWMGAAVAVDLRDVRTL